MTFTSAIRTCFQKYATFSGRASRAEYWWFVLFIVLAGLVSGALDGALFGTVTVETERGQVTANADGPISFLAFLFTVVPFIAAGWRRMHDTGRSGLHLIYPLIVILGIGIFSSFAGGLQAALSGSFAQAVSGLTGLILGIAGFIFLVSPLIVLWWLSRPSEPGANAYGPNPNEVMP